MDRSKTSFAQTPLFEGDAALLDTLIQTHPGAAAAARSLYEDGFAIVDFGFDDALIAHARAFTVDSMGKRERL